MVSVLPGHWLGLVGVHDTWAGTGPAAVQVVGLLPEL